MAHDLRFQVLILPNAPWPEYRDRFVHIEDLGLDVGACGDHFCNWADPPGYWLEAWTGLAGVAASTSTLRITTCVTQIPLRNPGVLAHQAVTLDHVSGGRFELGLGTGIDFDPSCEMVGLPNWGNKERVDRFAEYVQVVAQMLPEGVTSFAGDYYSTSEAVMNPGSLQEPRLPLMVAALAPRMMSLAVSHADIWNTLHYDPDFDVQLAETAERAATVDELCTQVGRDPGTLRRSFTVFDAEARATGGAIRYYDDPDLFVDLVQRLTDLGMTEISIYYPTQPDQIPKFEHIAHEVIPQLRAEHTG